MENPANRDDKGAAAPSRSRPGRWLRNLGFSAPIVATLAGALLLAGSLTVMRLADPSRRASGAPPRAVPSRTDIAVDRPVDPALGRAGTAADELRERGHIGDDDTLAPTGREGRLGSRVLTRTRQEHQGIPIFAAEVVVTSEDERIVQIHGHPASDISLDTVTPANDYPATVDLAEAFLDHAIAPRDDGTLVIVPVDGGGYRLAWLGVVIIDQGPEQVALDAETGAVLHRVPLILNVLGGKTPTGGDDR